MDLSKAQGVTMYIPTEGLFRSSSDFGSAIYRRVGNRIETFDVASILTPEERAGAQNQGELASRALPKLAQMGIDWQSLPAYNIGDIGTAAAKEGLQIASKAGASGGPDNYIHRGGDLLSLVKQKPQASTGSRALEFNTPSDIATAKNQLVEAQARPQAGASMNNYEQQSEINPETFGISRSYVERIGEGNTIGHQGKEYIVTPGGNLRLKGSELDDTMSQFDTLTELALSSGKTINPNLTPEQIAQIDPAEFLRQAEASISPEYKQKFDLLKRDLTTNLSRLGYDLSLKEKETQQAFERTNLQGGEELAGRGLAFSSNEQTFRQKTREARDAEITAAQETAYRSGTDVTRKAEELGGTETLASTVLPSIGGRSLSLTGTAQAPIIGSYQRDRQSLIESLAKENETQARNRQAYATRDLNFA